MSSPSSPPPPKKLQNISILCIGTRGDIQPYVAIGIVLKKKGYNIRFWTSSSYVEFVNSFGLTGVAICNDIETIMQETPSLRQAMAQGKTLVSVKALGDVAKEEAPRICQGALQEFQDHRPDLFLPNQGGLYFAWYAAIKLDIPFLAMAAQAIVYNRNHMMFGLPTLPFGLHYYLLYNILLPGLFDYFKPFDNYLDAGILKQVDPKLFRKEVEHPTIPFMVMTSPLFGQKLYPDASPLYKFVGTVVIESDQQINHPKFGGSIQRFQEFLDQGPAVYVGWGSMISKSTELMTELAVRAARYAGVRAIVLGGFAELSLEALEKSCQAKDKDALIAYARENILFTQTAPHEWLFPRVTCTVHHGGAGTTTTALRAGVPTIITPVFLDQHDFSYVVRQLGVGIGFTRQLQRIGWRALGRAIRRASTDATMKAKAVAVGRILRAENGAESAADLIEVLYEEYCLSGKLKAMIPKKADVTESMSKKRSAKKLLGSKAGKAL